MNFEYPKHWTIADVRRLASDLNFDRVLIRCPVSNEVLSAIEKEILRIKPDFTLCLDWRAESIDLSCLRFVPSVRRLVVQVGLGVCDLTPLKELRQIVELHLHVADLVSLDFLSGVNPNLESLSIGKTRSSKLNLEAIEHFPRLRMLKIDSQSKGIQVIGTLLNLVELSLSSVTLKDLSCLRDHDKLQSIAIKLGSLSDIGEITCAPNLRYVEFWRIRGLRDILALGQCTNLQYIYLQELQLVSELPSFRQLGKLRRIYLESMLSLATLFPITGAISLEDFGYANAKQFEVSDFNFLEKLRSLRRAAIGFNNTKRNEEMEALLCKLGYLSNGLGVFEFIE